MKDELLSVVIPAYNLEDYIEECIESIMNQTYKNLEIIIVDDGSSDQTYEICQSVKKKDERITLIRQENSGVTVARLRGLQEAHGKYVTFVDGDDYLDPCMYENMLPFMKNYDMVVCEMKRQYSDGYFELLTNGFEGIYDTGDKMEEVWQNMLYDFKKKKLHALSSGLVSKIYRRELLLPIMSWTDCKIKYGEDAVVVLMYTLQCKSLIFIKEAYYFYRFREGSVSNSLNLQMFDNMIRIYNILKKEFDKHYMADSLNRQLEKWINCLLIASVNKYMGFSKENRIPQFWIGLDEFFGKKLVVYGAGQMGQDIVWAYNQMGYSTYAWVDRNYTWYQKNNMDVQSIEILQNENFQKEIDVVLIAVSNENTAEKIKENLVQLGVAEEVIVWKEPVRV